MSEDKWKEFFEAIDWHSFVSKGTDVGIRVLISLLFLIVTFKLIGIFGRRMEKKILSAGKTDKTITKTLLYVAQIALKVLVCLCIVSFLGIDTSGLSAVITSLGVCVGLAVNGTLSNLAGGVLLLIIRPFKVDDLISVGEYMGTVENIHIVNTAIRTMDHRTVYIPNGTLSTSTVTNWTIKGMVPVKPTFSIAYDADIDKARRAILTVCSYNDRILKDPEPKVYVSNHNRSSVDLDVFAWVKTEDYFETNYYLWEEVKKKFDREGVEIPFPQMDVHIKQ